MVDSLAIEQRRAKPPPWLSSARSTVDSRTGEVKYYVWSYEGSKLWYHPAGVHRWRGSLPAYLKRSNLWAMTRPEVEEAVVDMAGRFGFDSLFTRVHQLDLAATMEMPRPVACYLPLLGSTPRFKRAVYEGESVIYRHGLRSLAFYDKGLKDGVEGNLLRFEVKFKKNLKQRLGWAVALSDLYEPSCFLVLVERWHTEYRRVRKVQRHTIEPTPYPRQLERQYAMLGMRDSGGEAAAVATVDTWPFDTKKKASLRKKIRELADASASEADADLIAELDAAVERAARLALGGAGGTISLDL